MEPRSSFPFDSKVHIPVEGEIACSRFRHGCLEAGCWFCSCFFEVLVILLSSSFLHRTEYFVFYIFLFLGSKSLLTRTPYSLLPTTQKFSQTVDCLPAKGRGLSLTLQRGGGHVRPSPPLVAVVSFQAPARSSCRTASWCVLRTS